MEFINSNHFHRIGHFKEEEGITQKIRRDQSGDEKEKLATAQRKSGSIAFVEDLADRDYDEILKGIVYDEILKDIVYLWVVDEIIIYVGQTGNSFRGRNHLKHFKDKYEGWIQDGKSVKYSDAIEVMANSESKQIDVYIKKSGTHDLMGVTGISLRHTEEEAIKVKFENVDGWLKCNRN